MVSFTAMVGARAGLTGEPDCVGAVSEGPLDGHVIRVGDEGGGVASVCDGISTSFVLPWLGEDRIS